MKKATLFTITILLSFFNSFSQLDEEKTGAWYMYFFNKGFGESIFGVQGDIQYRNWNLAGDLEQLLLRGGFTFRPENTNMTLTLGYANVTSGIMGEQKNNTMEHRFYQEALLPDKIGQRIFLTHRYRYEQRLLEEQDIRTRYRYALFMNLSLNKTELSKGTIYMALYNELFINGQRDIGNQREVELFDRNRTYVGIGYGLAENLRLQAGWMKQITDTWAKGQVQLSLHHSIR